MEENSNKMEQHNEEVKNRLNRKKIIIILVSLIVLAIAVTSIFLLKRGPVCGNNKCEYFENDCCKDCGCTEPGYICNINTNECGFKEFTILDEQLIELVTAYFTDRGKEVISINITDVVTWENKVGKSANVLISNQDWISYVIVTEDKEVVDVSL